MSHQHFYSRVPARVSLFNKRDGFDTFAHSASLDRSFILNELSALYADKLDIHSSAKLRKGKIPKVYSQAMLPSGRVAQTVVSYMPKDFTGERSAYLAHSLILTEEEKRSLLFSNKFTFFNPSMFLTDVSDFNLTSRSSSGNSNYADTPYLARPLIDGRSVISEYNPDMVKSLIYSLISSILGDGREVYFRLPYEDGILSEKALEFINALMSVLPFGLRERMSFVSFVSGPYGYNGFNLKCVSNDCQGIPVEKGVFYDFATGEIMGQSVEYAKHRSLALFLYSLFEYNSIRDEFHLFVDRIAEKYSDIAFDVQSLGDIAFMFWQCSGFYQEDSYLPTDESICRLLDIYAKYRDGLTEPHRVQAFRPLARYSKGQIAIPDGVYTRIFRLYPTECVPAKAVMLDVVLGLIHVDIMRERLFNFISRNYDGEIDRVKEVINLNLCRVFYGGFLQTRILRFFDLHFTREPISTRELIVDKLILSIRTPEIQSHIVAFFDKHYGNLTPAQKMKLCGTCLEMMPECDGLSALLVGLINHRIAYDGGDMANLMWRKLTEILESHLKAGDTRLMTIFVDNSGFCEDIALRCILGGGIMVDSLVDLLASMPAHKRIAKLVRVNKAVPGLSDEEYSRLLDRFNALPLTLGSTLYDVIQADRMAGIALIGRPLNTIREAVIYPTVVHTFLDVFKLELGVDGIDTILKYADGKPALTESKQYSVVLDFIRMIELCDADDSEGAFKIAVTLPDKASVRTDIAEYIKVKCFDSDNQSESVACTYRLLMNYLNGSSLGFDLLYSEYKSLYEEAHREEGSIRSKIEPVDRMGAANAAELIISHASSICEASGELAEIVTDESSGFKTAISEFVSIYGLGAAVFLKRRISQSHYGITDIIDEVIQARNASINSVDDALDIVLRRK